LPHVHHHCIPKRPVIDHFLHMPHILVSCQKSSSITFTTTLKLPCYVALRFVSQSVGPLSPNAVSMAIAVSGLSGHPEEDSCCICESGNYSCMQPNPRSWRNALNSSKTQSARINRSSLLLCNYHSFKAGWVSWLALGWMIRLWFLLDAGMILDTVRPALDPICASCQMDILEFAK
jgi:hypothetical protein